MLGHILLLMVCLLSATAVVAFRVRMMSKKLKLLSKAVVKKLGTKSEESEPLSSSSSSSLSSSASSDDIPIERKGELVGDPDIIIVGAGVAGSALAYVLGKEGIRILVIERDLKQPVRMVGELLQPGGYSKLVELGLEDCVEDIDAQDIKGYAIFMGGKSTRTSYPSGTIGRCFHNGRFVQRMREKAASLPNVWTQQGTVTSLINEENGTVQGVVYKTKGREECRRIAPLTVVCDGSSSANRRFLCDPQVDVLSCSVGLILEKCKLPYPNHGHVILAKQFAIALYPISSTEVRCLVDMPTQDAPRIDNGDMATFLKSVVFRQVPYQLKEAFLCAVDRGNLRMVSNKSMPASQRFTPGAILLGDAFNMRHPITSAGMMVALCDVGILSNLLKHQKNMINDEVMLQKCLNTFHNMRKLSASTINTLADASYQVLGTSPTPVGAELCAIAFDFASLGGYCSNTLLALLSGSDLHPLSVTLYLLVSAIYGMWRIIPPAIASIKRLLLGVKLMSTGFSIFLSIAIKQGLLEAWASCVFASSTYTSNYQLQPDHDLTMSLSPTIIKQKRIAVDAKRSS